MPRRVSITRLILSRALPSAAVLGLLAGAAGVSAIVALELGRARAERAIYRDRLETLTHSYVDLTGRYNDAVRRTAVTELVVEAGELSVSVRDAAGELTRVETPYDPAGEIYVDFAVIEGRVWIRRVFDAATPPMFGTVIDPALAQIDWDAEHASHGKAVYRSLAEGRWTVSVSGSGALTLDRADERTPVALAPPPAVSSFAEIEAEARREAKAVTWRDVLVKLIESF